MMNHRQSSTSSPKGAVPRVSLACIPCRTRHVKCDAKRPQCDRCSAESKQCHYSVSRRGGLDRAALAARRNFAATGCQSPSLQRIPGHSILLSSVEHSQQDGSQSTLPFDDGYVSQTERSTSFTVGDGTPRHTQSSCDGQSPNITKDPLIDLYYKHFHRLHSCILPRMFLERLLEDTAKKVNWKPLISVMRFIGSLYAHSCQSRLLKESVAEAIIESQQDLPNGFMAQCHLLYSISLYWYGEEARSREEMDRAIHIALNLSMHCRHYAAENGYGDPVLQESWRRTWWQIYLVDAHFAAMKHVCTYQTCEVDITTELPCEEHEYESGAIPLPKTLEDFNFREFAADNHVYSSFAYLIGATRGISSAIARVLSDISNGSSHRVLEAVDAVIDGWLHLLPESKREILSKNGEIDGHMFEAHMALHAATIGLHRPFSGLLFDPLETISSCSPTPPDRWLRRPPESEIVHTTRCLKSIEAQIRLLALPTRPISHTPFTVCMLATGTISLLSACKFLLTGQKLAIGRDQIRMSIGYLKSFAGVWPLADKSLQEVQTIAREVLRQQHKDLYNASHVEKSLTNNVRELDSTSDLDAHEEEHDYALPPPSLDSLQTYLNLSDLQTDISAWFTEH